MRRARTMTLAAVVIGGSILAGVLLVRAARQPQSPRPPRGILYTNESFINGLYQNENLLSVRDAFRMVFESLDDEVTVYPSENYYYFRTAIRGKTYAGALLLAADKLDSGVIGIGYSQVHEDRLSGRGKEPITISHTFGPVDGVNVEKQDDFSYAVTYHGKRVVFNFFKEDVRPPKKLKLLPDEQYVGPCFDESGLRFAIIFNQTTKHLYWILNEDGFLPEDFTPVAPNVVEGDRTEYVFYMDSVTNRKLLVGVNAFNTAANNWFDGPFDQMPDNYVRTGQVNLRKYLALDLGIPESRMDRFGNMTGRNDRREFVAPCSIYFDLSELRFIDTIRAQNLPPSQFFSRITAARFGTPPEWKPASELMKNDSLMRMLGKKQ
ncbi:MAG TPA: hypothetical protein VHI13_14980 [Candidatus Kapabacteria bacterium]|nr:hypothetical protein [Candidatus Kapabacteria bacterium]